MIKAFYSINSLLGEVTSILIAYTTLSVNDLAKEAKDVFSALKEDNLIDARKRVSRIVGRDTENMDEREIIRAAGSLWQRIHLTVLLHHCFILPLAGRH